MIATLIVYLTRKLKQAAARETRRLIGKFNKNAERREAAYQKEQEEKRLALETYNLLKANATACRKAKCASIQKDSAKVMVHLAELNNL